MMISTKCVQLTISENHVKIFRVMTYVIGGIYSVLLVPTSRHGSDDAGCDKVTRHFTENAGVTGDKYDE